MTGPRLRWHVHADREDFERAAVDAIAERAAGAIRARGEFAIVLSGGATPRPVYSALPALATPWQRWQVYFADERCLPIGDAGRNDSMARALWLDRVSMPAGRVHAIPAELGPEAGAAAYARALSGVGPFDLVLLGLGEDGHTASLFPGQPVGSEPGSPDVLAVLAAPKPPAERVSLSAARLARAAAVFVLVAGADKRDAVAELRAGGKIPLSAIRPSTGIDLFVDAAAGS